MQSSGNETPEATVHQPGAFPPEQARPGEVHLADGPVAAEGHVAHGRKMVEVFVPFPPRLHLRPRLPHLLVLHLQLDLVHLQLVENPLRFFLRPGRGLLLLARFQPLFRPAAQLGGIQWLLTTSFHGCSPLFRQTPERFRRPARLVYAAFQPATSRRPALAPRLVLRCVSPNRPAFSAAPPPASWKR